VHIFPSRLRGQGPERRGEPGAQATSGGGRDRARGAGLRRRPVVAWAEYRSPEGLPNIHHRKEYVATAERLPDYRVTCILVERGLRGQGLAAIALRGAIELIARAGGGLVEGYPHDTGGVRKKNSSFLYNGTRTMYEREGFTYDRPKGQGNCVMAREVAPSTRD